MCFQLANLLLDRRFVDSCDMVMRVGFNPKGCTDCRQKLLLMHRAETLHRLVLDPLGDFTQPRDGHDAEFFIGVCHRSSIGRWT